MTNSKKDTFLPETENWLQTRKANEQKLQEAGVWNASQEHDACGVGFVASVDGLSLIHI